jgi:hypothetical protein
MNGAKKFQATQKVSSWKKMFHEKKLKDKKYLGHFLEVQRAPEPEVILWENYNVTKNGKRLRHLLVHIIMLFLLAFCMAGIIVSQYFADQSNSKYNTKDCGTTTLTMDQAYSDAM